jgi:hypothetical protein
MSYCSVGDILQKAGTSVHEGMVIGYVEYRSDFFRGKGRAGQRTLSPGNLCPTAADLVESTSVHTDNLSAHPFRCVRG